ncbi:MAG: Uma2 family endonuclease, partial [Acidobacteriota bacterium]|nr:Uma2 family endonuclease [Acidobacteriota bacterium]
MQLIVEDFETLAPVVLHPEPMTDDEFYDFSQQYPNCSVERTAEGEILITPPAGCETGNRNGDLTAQLVVWIKRDGRGKAFDSNAEFMLPNGAARAPDASWISRVRL